MVRQEIYESMLNINVMLNKQRISDDTVQSSLGVYQECGGVITDFVDCCSLNHLYINVIKMKEMVTDASDDSSEHASAGYRGGESV